MDLSECDWLVESLLTDLSTVCPNVSPAVYNGPVYENHELFSNFVNSIIHEHRVNDDAIPIVLHPQMISFILLDKSQFAAVIPSNLQLADDRLSDFF